MRIPKIVMMNPADLTPHPNNPRHNEATIAGVADSIRDAGFRQPIVVDKNHVIVIGHTRREAAMLLGLAEVPVIVADHLSETECAAIRIADNRTGEFATWNIEALEAELQTVVLPDSINLAEIVPMLGATDGSAGKSGGEDESEDQDDEKPERSEYNKRTTDHFLIIGEIDASVKGDSMDEFWSELVEAHGDEDAAFDELLDMLGVTP